MNKYYGMVGYVSTQETSPGVWEEVVTERPYYGDVLRFANRVTNSGTVIDSFELNNKISILSDPYAYQNFSAIRYIEWLGSKWKVDSVEVQFPRLILSIGDLYNGETIS